MGDVEGDELEVVRGILVEVQLAQFFTRVRDDLQVSVCVAGWPQAVGSVLQDDPRL